MKVLFSSVLMASGSESKLSLSVISAKPLALVESGLSLQFRTNAHLPQR
jgi:hypothetical protein